MEKFIGSLSKNKHHLLLVILLTLFIVFDVPLPDFVSELVDIPVGKVGVAVGVTDELTSKFNAVTIVKIASVVMGGKGGGGRKDFAQAGGSNKDKIEEAFKNLSAKIN